MKWFRVYSEIKDDPKMLELDDHQRWLWLCLMSCANEAPERGVITGVRLRGLAAALRTTEDKLREALTVMQELDMLEYDQDAATITLCHWNDRQYDKPSDTPPATRARQRMSRQRHADVTPCHATYTDTDTDTDTEEIQRQKQSRPKAAGASAPAGKPASPLPPPAAQVFVENGGKWPSGKLADGTSKRAKAIATIAETVGDDPDALSFWGRVVAAYCLQWSGHSYTTMLGYFRDRRIPGEAGRNGNGHGRPRENAALAAVRIRQAEDARSGNYQGDSRGVDCADDGISLFWPERPGQAEGPARVSADVEAVRADAV
jgi:hypothetical protein